MSDLDFTLKSLPMLLSRNKSQEWQDMILGRTSALLLFLKDKNLLVNVEPFDEGGKLKPDTVIKKSNVTTEGLELFKKAIPNWEKYLDKGGAVNNLSILEKGLEKIGSSK